MREIVKRVMAYQYDELGDDAKDKAVASMSDIGTDYGWWEYCYDDAKSIGLEIEEFDTYRHTIGGKLIESVANVIEHITETHGADCDTYKTAEEYRVQLLGATCKQCSRGNEEDCESDCEAKREEVEAEFEHALLEDYLSILRKEFEYLVVVKTWRR